MRRRILTFSLLFFGFLVRSATGQGINISFTLPEAGYLTLVVDASDGTRVRNLIQNTYFTAGDHTVFWDGYDEGRAVAWSGGSYSIERQLVEAGTYTVRGLLHKGIDLIYEFSVQSPGNPAWHTSNYSGAWLSDHAPPIDIVSIPAGVYKKFGPLVQIVAPISETGHGLIYVTEDGQKILGLGHINNNHDFPRASTRDVGSAADREYMTWHAVRRSGKLKLVYTMPTNAKVSTNQFSTGISTNDVYGIAAYNNRVAISYDDGIVFIDGTNAKSKKYEIINTVSMPGVRGIATDGTYLYVIQGNALKRFAVDFTSGRLSNEQTIVSGLSDPQRVRHFGEELFVSDHGSSHQIKVFSLSGSHKRNIGLAGGPQVGRYDERRMAYPMGFDIDSQGKLWVAEFAYMPKRISKWDASTGAFERAFYGPPKYGGGLVLDPADPGRAYYSGEVTGTIEFALNWSTGESKPSRILLNREAHGLRLPPTRKGSDSPVRVHVVNGRRYMFTPAWSQSHAAIYAELGIWVERGDTLAWVGQVGTLEDWVRVFNDPQRYPEIYSYIQSYYPKSNALFVWSDADGNGDVSLDELGFYDYGYKKSVKPYLDKDLNIHFSDGSLLPLGRIDSRGVPIYDIKDFQRGEYVLSGTEGQIVYGEGTLITTHGPIEGYIDGKRTWLYHSQWPRRAAGAPLGRFEGDLIRTTRVLSPPLPTPYGEAGSVWALNSENGEIYLFTTDGLYIATLLADTRRAPLWRYNEGVISRGDPIGNVSPSDEHFWPFLNTGPNGEIFLTAGKEHSSITRVEGLQNIRRLNLGSVTVTSEMLADLSGTTNDATPTQKRKSLTAHIRGNSPTADGQFLEWSAADWQVIDVVRGIKGAVAVDSDSLYVALRTGMPDLMNNAGDDYRYLFATGGGIDIWLGKAGADPERTTPVQGDKRVFITRAGANPQNGILIAALYEQANSNAPAGSEVRYSSPVGSITLKHVADISSAVSVGTNDGDYEVAIPLNILGLSPSEGLSILGDFGVLTGDGVETQWRIYWNNKTNVITADIPSEARLTPELWGIWTFYNGGDAMNSAPAGQITNPVDGAAFMTGSNVLLEADVSDADGTVTSVAFYANDMLLGIDTSYPYQYSWTGAKDGKYDIEARIFDDGYAVGRTAPVSIEIGGTVTQNTLIHLQQGWNLISSNVKPHDTTLGSIFASILDDVVLVKDHDGNVYSPENGIDAIGQWDIRKAYSVYVERDVDLSITGTSITPEGTPVTLPAGWNFIPYLRKSTLDIITALSSLQDALIIVKDASGRTYYPEYGINSINLLEPGQGYKIFTQAGGELIYQANESSSPVVLDKSTEPNRY